MSRIVETIPPENFELIRNRIAEILIDEFGAQYLKNYDPELANVQISLEDNRPVNKIDPPLINVCLLTGDYSAKAYNGNVKGGYQFGIDCYSSAKSKNGVAGSVTSSFRLQRLLGMCRYILEHTAYKTLGFTPGFITGVSCSNFTIAQPKENDAENFMMGRLVFNVGCAETTSLVAPTIAAGYDTVVKMGNTNRGYKYTSENYL